MSPEEPPELPVSLWQQPGDLGDRHGPLVTESIHMP